MKNYSHAIRLADFGGNTENIDIAFKNNIMGFKKHFGKPGDFIIFTSTINSKKCLLGFATLDKKTSNNPFTNGSYHCWDLINLTKFDPIEVDYLMKLIDRKYWLNFQTPKNIRTQQELVVPILSLINQVSSKKIIESLVS